MPTDTRPQDTARSAKHGYGSDVDSESLTAARKARDDLVALEAAVDAARVRRDQAIADLHTKEGWRAPDISRALDMSLSNVRLILAKTPTSAR